MLEQIQAVFQQHASLVATAAPLLERPIMQAAESLVAALDAKRKLLICGNGGSACQAQHLAAELVGRFQQERIALPAIALTADSAILTSVANDYGYVEVFARQIEALGNTGDILFAITTSGQSKNILRAIEVAHRLGLSVIVLTGANDRIIKNYLAADDLVIAVPSAMTVQIQELHLLIVHCLALLVEQLLLPVNPSSN